MLNAKFKKCLCALLWVFSFCSSAQAELLGDVVKPFVSVRTVYDSNIFRVSGKDHLQALIGDDQLSDVFTIVSVGTALHYEISRQTISLFLKKDFLHYLHYSSQNSDRDEARARVTLRVYDRISADITGRYSKEPVPREDSRLLENAEEKRKAAGLTLGYDLPLCLLVKVGVQAEKITYSDSELRSRERVNKTFTATGLYAPSPESRFYASYVRSHILNGTINSIGKGAINSIAKPR